MKRAAEEAETSKPSAKRGKFEDENAKVTASFDDLNSDCLVNILSFLSNYDMNSVAECSTSCHEARANDSLDQTRTGTIICTENTTLESIRQAFIRQEWNQVFTGNRTRMKVVGLERMPVIERYIERAPTHVLPNVSSLDLSFNSFAGDRIGWLSKPVAFAVMLPNLEEIDLSHTTNVPYGYVATCGEVCRNLWRVIWNSCERKIHMDGSGLPRDLTEAYLDNSQLYTRDAQRYSLADGDSFLFDYCYQLERLSILNMTWAIVGGLEPPQPVNQEMLIKMVRQHPTLRWLRSDLSQENITMLQREKPDITFVIE